MKQLLFILGLTFSVAASAQTPMQEYYAMLANQTPAITYDADAQAFFTAASISSTTIKGAVNQLVLDLKSNSLWTKFYALYPMVYDGISNTTSDQAAYNLINPSNYKITWSGSPVFSATGVSMPTGSDYGNTNLNASTVLTANNTHLSYYSTLNSSPSGHVMGAYTASTASFLFTTKLAGFVWHSDSYNDGTGRARVDDASLSSAAYTMATRTSTASHTIYRNGVSIVTTSTSGGSLPNTTVLIGRSQFAASTSTPTCALASVGQGFSSTEAATLYTIITTFETALSRNN